MEALVLPYIRRHFVCTIWKILQAYRYMESSMPDLWRHPGAFIRQGTVLVDLPRTVKY